MQDAGKVSKLPIAKLASLTGGFKFTADSLHIAIIGKDDKNGIIMELKEDSNRIILTATIIIKGMAVGTVMEVMIIGRILIKEEVVNK